MHVGPCTRTRDYSPVPVEHKPDRDAQAATSTRLRASNVARIEATWPITVLHELLGDLGIGEAEGDLRGNDHLTGRERVSGPARTGAADSLQQFEAKVGMLPPR
jgi:hypothetical protein